MLRNWWFNNKKNKKRGLRHFFGAAFFLCLLFSGFAQNSPYQSGFEFLTIPTEPAKNIRLGHSMQQNVDTMVQTRLHFFGSNAGCATVVIPGRNFSVSVWVAKDSMVTVDLPQNPYYQFETVQAKGVLISCTVPMALLQSTGIGKGGGFGTDSVIFNNYNTNASTIIPSAIYSQFQVHNFFAPGSSYIFPLLDLTSGMPFTVISEANSNQLEIKFGSVTQILPFNTGIFSFQKGTTHTFVINRGEFITFYSTAQNPGEQINHGYIQSLNNKSYKLYIIPNDHRAYDDGFGIGYAYEDLKPAQYYGTSYHCAPILANMGNQYSLMAVKDSTVISYNGVAATILDSLARLDTAITGPLQITSNHPIAIFLSPANNALLNASNNASSPFSVTQSADNELISESLFATLDETDSLNHYILGVVTKTANAQLFKLDGINVGAASFTPFVTDSAWCWANIVLQKGTHKAQSDSGFHAFQYTYYNAKPINYSFPSYGYVLAQSIAWPQDSFAFKAGINPNALAAFSSFNDTLCPGQPLYLQANHLRHTTWYWQFGDGSPTQMQHATQNRAPGLSHSWASAGQYWVTVTDSAGCAASDSLLITVGNFIEANFTATTTTSCSGTFVKLQNQSVGALDYVWQWPGGSSTAQNPSFNYLGADSAITISLIANNQNCADTASQTIILHPSSIIQQSIPNVITPNNDGVNDAFCITEAAGFIDCFYLQIINRWGSEVFKTENPQDCWQAQNAAAGVYFYILKIRGQQYNGQITVFN